MQDPNPYFGILANADLLVVTSDSVSMISEALASAALVEVIEVPTNARQRAFVSLLLARGLFRLATGDPVPGSRTPTDATREIAATVQQRLFGRDDNKWI